MLLKEAERREKRASLIQYKASITSAVDVLKSIKTDLSALKTAITIDTTNFVATDITDVQTIIDYFVSQVASI